MRYYDPIVRRFISPEPNFRFGEFDKEAGLSAYNVYAYCANNPVNFCDQTGEFIITTCVICCIAGAAIGATVGGIIGNVYAEKKGYVSWDKAKCIIAGAVIGGLA